MVFLVRRLIFVFALIYLEDLPSTAVVLVLLLNLAFIFYIAEVNPHTQPSLRNLELLNEFILQAVTYQLLVTWLSTGVEFDWILG